MLFPVKIKRYLIYKTVNSALFISIRTIILTTNIYILIALALDESIILDVPQFPMQNIYQSCDLGRAIGRSKVNTSQ